MTLPARRKQKKHPVLRATATAAALLALLVADSTLRLVTNEFVFRSARLPAGLDGLRVVVLSDLHGASFGPENSRLLDAVRAAEPDLIALTGDFIDTSGDIDAVAALSAALSAMAPVYFVSGNHDWSSGALETLAARLEENSVICLRNESVTLSRGGESIILCGLEDPNGPADMIKPGALMDRIAETHPDAFVLVLAHRNFWPERYPFLKADLIVCGHGHGGIVRLPFVGGLIGTGFEFLPDNTAGFCEMSGRGTMFVSRGLSDSLPAPRFLNNPQVAVITLQAE